ncbi:uracil-DNA glycosylase [Eudoraea chungangensis]|uniref:uracil-DNA glycosylase n=1 Tax=Eudoraea chungangensis TaxID=1481905 RepID=UPI0023EB4444|nr:uracil-DNA glycosylase [Eudoraea chungangensis]
MRVNIQKSWKNQLKGEFEKPYFQELANFVREEYKNNTCYPEEKNIFAAFNHCPFNAVKVVILGQDPYHGPMQAKGMSFSVGPELDHPPSLKNIFKELEKDVGKPYPQSGDLTSWAKQGVLLLNATLTVREKQPGSHQNKGWEKFTDEVIKTVSNNKEGIIFLLWGGYAKKKGRLIDRKTHYILESGHPSPLSANRGYWFGNKHFSKTNKLLLELERSPIRW